MSLAQKLKSIVKGKEVKVNTFGTNPSDPWSTKAGLAEASDGQTEGGLLKRYLMSRGIDPRYVSKDTRISHSKSGEFMKWKQDHMSESVDEKDTVTLDIPLIIRVLELAREDLKSDMDLHRVVEKLIEIRNKGTLTMDDYDYIASIKEDYAHIIEAKEGNYGGDYQSSVLAVKAKAEKKPVDMKSLAARMQASYAKDDKKPVKEGVIDSVKKAWKKVSEFDDANPKHDGNTRRRQELRDKLKNKTVKESNGYDDNRTGFAKKPREDDEGHGPSKFKPKDTMSRPHTVHIDGKPWKKFSSGHQAHAAVNTLAAKGKKAVAIAHFKEELDPVRQKELTRSARIIKSLYKNKKVQADQDGTQQTPKVQAAAVLKGGKTMTGQPRDTIEIDPMLRTRPGAPDPSKNVKK